MSELPIVVRYCVDELRLIESKIGKRTRSVIPSKCWEAWESLAALHRVLSGAKELLEAREAVLVVLKKLAIDYRKEPNQPLSFQQARHLKLSSYATVTWSIYDRLANVCGRLHATEFKGVQNPKLCWDILPKGKRQSSNSSESNDRKWKNGSALPFSGRRVVEEAYAWPIRISYTIRNWLVHEGYNLDDSFGTTRLFEGDSLDYGFVMSLDAKQSLEKNCQHVREGDDQHPQNCCLNASDPWIGSSIDLLVTLEAYHGEIDQMFAGMLQWSVDAFRAQFEAFTRHVGSVGE